MSWDNKLKRLQENLDLNTEKLANTLGITTRTLADFMKGKEPTTPIQKLIDLLLGEVDSEVVKKPQLNLVIIHCDFRVHGQDAVSTVFNMHAAAGTQHNNEFHYVTVDPGRDTKWAFEGLKKYRIQPRFFVCEDGLLNTQEARDCFFTTTTVWLVTQAMRRDLAHITIAANAMKFWPLAKEFKELAGVPVTFVRETVSNPEEAKNMEDAMTILKKMGFSIADPSGRKFGVVHSLKSKVKDGKIDFGWITPGQQSSAGVFTPEGAQEGKEIFFSYNHMRKGQNDSPEIEISELVENDYVSYSVGMNNKGACATDVALVTRAPNAPQLTKPAITSATAGLPRRNSNVTEENELLEILKDAIVVCANEDGWALSSEVGSRVSVLHSNFKDRLLPLSYTKIAQFAQAHQNIIESSIGAGKLKAACMRLKPTKG